MPYKQEHYLELAPCTNPQTKIPRVKLPTDFIDIQDQFEICRYRINKHIGDEMEKLRRDQIIVKTRDSFIVPDPNLQRNHSFNKMMQKPKSKKVIAPISYSLQPESPQRVESPQYKQISQLPSFQSDNSVQSVRKRLRDVQQILQLGGDDIASHTKHKQLTQLPGRKMDYRNQSLKYENFVIKSPIQSRNASAQIIQISTPVTSTNSNLKVLRYEEEVE